MKNVFLIPVIIFCACNGEVTSYTKLPPAPTFISPDEEVLQRAKILEDSASMYVELSEMRKITVREANAKIAPIMKRMDSLKRLMSVEGEAQLQQYRIEKMNEIIDRKIKRDN